jgi:hypothetical protein
MVVCRLKPVEEAGQRITTALEEVVSMLKGGEAGRFR